MAQNKGFNNRILLSPPHQDGRELKYIQEAFDDNWIVPLGPHVETFEKKVVSYLGKSDVYAVAMNSGTSAIHIALKLLNVEAGDEVFCSSATFVASANPILYEKAVPVFVDSEENTWNICPDALLAAISAKKKSGKVPRVLICADLFGMSARYDVLEEICDHYDIQIIEDAAESLGSAYKGGGCGTFGKFGVFSFNGNKIITTSGGGMLITHSLEEAKKAVFLITQARDPAPYYLHSTVGYNYRMSNVCAGIGLGQLETLDERVAARRRNFEFYRENLQGVPLKFSDETEGSFSNRWLSTALITDRENRLPSELIQFLDDHNIEARRIWKPLHTQPLFSGTELFKVKSVAVSEEIFKQGLCLPSGSHLDERTLSEICSIIKRFFS